MNIGELFINLGIKGSEKTVAALGGVKKGLGEVSSMSLEAKAGIIAAIYALEKLTSASFATGNELKNFSTVTGVSAKTLQQYEYAGKRVGATNQEIEGSFKNLQSAMTKALLNKGVPESLGLIGRTLKQNFTQDSIKDFAAHPEKLLQVLQQYAQTEKNIGVRNESLKAFGINDNVIAGMAANVFRPEILNRAPIISDKEIDSLQKGNAALSDLGNHIEKAFAHFNAKHGQQMVADLTKITDAIIKLVTALTDLAEKLHLFDALSGVITNVATLISPDKKEVDKNIKAKDEEHAALKKLSYGAYFKTLLSGGHAVTPNIQGRGPEGNSHTTNVNQTLNFNHDGRDPHRNADSHKKAAVDAYRQNPALARGT